MAKRTYTKRQYESLGAARGAIFRMAEQYHGIVYKKAYRCATCKAWHITSTPPPRGRRIKR